MHEIAPRVGGDPSALLRRRAEPVRGVVHPSGSDARCITPLRRRKVDINALPRSRLCRNQPGGSAGAGVRTAANRSRPSRSSLQHPVFTVVPVSDAFIAAKTTCSPRYPSSPLMIGAVLLTMEVMNESITPLFDWLSLVWILPTL